MDYRKTCEQHLRMLKETWGSALEKQYRVSELQMLELDSVMAFSKSTSTSAEVHTRTQVLCSLLH